MRQFIEISTSPDLESMLASSKILGIEIRGWQHRVYGHILPETLKVSEQTLTARMSLECPDAPIPLSVLRAATVIRIIQNGGSQEVILVDVLRRWFEATPPHTHMRLISPTDRIWLPFSRTFSPKEYERIKLGITPVSSDDHWYVYFQDEWLYIHRSWTGVGVFQVHIEADEDAYRVSEVWMNATLDPQLLKVSVLNDILQTLCDDVVIFD